MMKLNDVLERCSKTGAWYGVEIPNINVTNDMGDTPLHTVCSWGDPESVLVLISSGANVNAIGDKGSTPIFNAIIGENYRVIELLLKNGANKKMVNELGRTPLQFAENISAAKEIIDLLK